MLSLMFGPELGLLSVWALGGSVWTLAGVYGPWREYMDAGREFVDGSVWTLDGVYGP